MDFLGWKMAEHSAWYSGDAEVLANFYTEYVRNNVQDLPYPLKNGESFWGRQYTNQGEIVVHVPIAGDIAETSANFLFGESPYIRLAEAKGKNQLYKKTQEELDMMLLETGLFRKILEAAESASAIGGVFVKIAWDQELSEYPIPVIMQADKAIPEFTFGILTAVTFWKTFEYDDSKSKVYRLFERYERGKIINTLYVGTSDRLGTSVTLSTISETADLPEVVETPDDLFVVYVPNMLPNRLDRSSYLGRSDYSGIEGLMDSLDETYSSWVKDIALAQAKILIPESYLQKQNGRLKYNIDQMLYVKLDVDPLSSPEITPQQFAIRADEFEKTTINLLERIVTSAGYSPQSFGINIEGRAESGTALQIRERKSFATKAKKEMYWQPVLKKLIKLMMLANNEVLSGKMELDSEINISFSDGMTNNLSEVASSIKMVSDALAASTETKVRLLHTDWEEDQIQEEVKKIQEENGLSAMMNPDIMQLSE